MRRPIERAPFAGIGRTHPKEHDRPGLLHDLHRSGFNFTSESETRAAFKHAEPNVSPAHLYEVGLTAAAMSFHTVAIEALRRCTELAPDHSPAWHKLAELLRLARQDAQADVAEVTARVSVGTKWKKAAGERVLDRLHKTQRKWAERLKGKETAEAAGQLREHLIANPLDAAAMRWLARLEAHSHDAVTARALFERALDLCPAYIDAREDYAQLLLDEHDFAAVAETGRLFAESADNSRFAYLHVQALLSTGRADAALEILVGLLRQDPNNAPYWLAYGMGLRALGRREESVQAFRKCLQVQPNLGEAYWGLAELKDRYITQADIADMRAHLEEDTLKGESRMHMLYALGSALERSKDFAGSFGAYEDAARVYWEDERAKPEDSDMAGSGERLERIKTVFSRANFANRLVQAPETGPGDVPIFVVGMPRAGSTLIEQILSSHSLVEGIGELPLIGETTRKLAFSRILVEPNAYPDCLLEMTRGQIAALGARVIARSRDYRKTARPYFVDKRPWNWLEVGLIHLILPQAKIIDIRREPMAACFAMFKQLLPRECTFSYDLAAVGHYYRRYVGLMEHWNSVLPDKVHFVRYEHLVGDTESEIRRLLDYCGLPFEENCLRFWETERTVATPSAEQVRRPIFRDALEQWRNFEPWLTPLRGALEGTAEA